MTKLLGAFLILSCSVLFGCTGGKGTSTSANPIRSLPLAASLSETDRIDNKTTASQPEQTETDSPDGKQVWMKDSNQETEGPLASEAELSDQAPIEQRAKAQLGAVPRKAGSVRTSVPRRVEPSLEPRAFSFAQKNDSEDDDLSALFTADYMSQFDIPIVFNDAVQYFIRYFTTEKRKVFVNWLRRSRRYVPMIKNILQEQGLPEDLIYLAMIESGFNPKAYSPMKACGPWQFIYETGGRYGLKVNHWVDERRDPEKSTVAAAMYLKDLFNQFGNWYLAAAGYNAGEKRIERAVEEHETTDFWEIARYNTLPRETRDYIPRLLAAAIIAKDPEKFGFTDISYDRPVRFVNEKVPGATPLPVVARAASTDLATLKSLNPEILTNVTPPDADAYVIKLPETVNRGRFQSDLSIVLEREKKLLGVVTHVCKKRDNLASIARRYNVTQNDLLLVNSCDQEISTKLGSVVYVPKFEQSVQTVESRKNPIVQAELKVEHGKEAFPQRRKKGASYKPVRAGNSAVTHKKPPYRLVKKGENSPNSSKGERASKSRLSQASTKGKRNGMVSRRKVRSVDQGRVPERQARPVAYHIVKKGETLSEIADKYDVDSHTLKEMNRLKGGKIRHGTRLKISQAQN
jgi:membrane-bound lytic murein transglycosylase D